jgi:hypothetical protein
VSTRQEVYAVIDTERSYQELMAIKAHGDPSNDYNKSLENFALYIASYSAELTNQLSRTWGPDAYKAALDTVRKIAALGVAAMEVHGAQPRVAPTKHTAGTDLT